ncbi:MAG: glycosyltransferase family 4 protein [Ignavibacterium sp.]|nr:glycosyltransferase family 4 protein [Ignavibacterium sp.]
MKVLIVCSRNAGYISPFIKEQAEAVESLKIEINYFLIRGKGFSGYLKNLPGLKKKITDFNPDLIHAHYGLSGLLAALQRKIPVIITFHGSDAYLLKIKFLSKIAARLSKFNIYVSKKIMERIDKNNHNAIIPCGINLEIFQPIEMKIAREELYMEPNKKYILFASRFNNSVKNASLAFEALNKLDGNTELLELKNRSREEVNMLLNACDLLLLTSFSEGSPQIIKEAMACNCPIVATDVGDIKDVIAGTEGCFITKFDPVDVAEKIKLALDFNKRTNGREQIRHFDNNLIAKEIVKCYQKFLDRDL